MKFNDRSMALLGIPDLPPRAFIRKAGGGIIPQGGGGSSPTQTETKTTGMPAWALPYAQSTLAKQSALADRPYEAYGAERIAGFSPLQEQAKAQAAGMQTSGATGAGIGLAGAAGLGGLNTQNFGSAQADQYMSPYMQNVVDIQKREAQRQSGIQGAQQQAQAAQAGAFGGSRDAIMRAERERNLGTQMGDIQAQGSQAAYTNAQQQFNADQARGLQGLGFATSAANTLGQLGGQQFQQGMDINKLQSAYGAQEQGMKQQGLDLAYQDFQNQKNYPQQQLGYMANMINGLPIGSTSTATSTGTPGSPSGLQTLGALGMGAYGMSQMPSFGLSKFFADGGLAEEKSVTDEDNIEEFVHGLNDQQLAQAKQAAQASGDKVKLNVIEKEEGFRASVQRGGLASLPVDMSKMMPTTLSAARGGIVAFAGNEEDGSLVNSGVYSPGDEGAYKKSISRAGQLMEQLYGLKPTPQRTTAERDADIDRYYKKMQAMGGPDLYADYENELKGDKASLENDMKEAKAMAIFAGIPEILKGNDFATAAGNTVSAVSKAYGESSKANKANKRAITKGLLELGTGRRAEKLGYLKDAQAYSDAMDKALKEGNTAEYERLKGLALLEQGMARVNKPQRAAGGASKDKGVDNLGNILFASMIAEGAPNNAITKGKAFTQAANIFGKREGDVVSDLAAQRLTLDTNVKAVTAGNDAVKRLTLFDDAYREATPAQKKEMARAVRLEAENGIKRMERQGGTRAPAAGTGGPTLSNW
jgi:hypothetical protein